MSAMAAVDTFSTAVVAGVTRVGRLTVSASNAAAAPLLGGSLATTLTDGVSRLMTSQLADTLIHEIVRARTNRAATLTDDVGGGGSGVMPSVMITGGDISFPHFSTLVAL
jgi:hypothetical protein